MNNVSYNECLKSFFYFLITQPLTNLNIYTEVTMIKSWVFVLNNYNIEKFINLLHNHFDASYRQTFFAVGVNAPKDKMAQCRVGAKIGTDDMKSYRLC